MFFVFFMFFVGIDCLRPCLISIPEDLDCPELIAFDWL